jgi:integrase
VTALHDHRRRMTEERLKAGPEWTESELVFVAATGLPLDPSNVSHMGRRHLKRAGRPDLALHGLRHSCASLLLAQGIEPLLIKEILGHSQVSFTLSIYAHLMPGAHRRAATAMEEVLGASERNPCRTAVG